MKQSTTVLHRVFLVPLLAVAILAAGAWFGQAAYGALLDPVNKVTEYSTQTPGGIVYVQEVDKKMHLFLPREADTEHISLLPPAGNPDARVLFLVNGEESDVLALSSLTPSDDKYRVDVVVRDAEGAQLDAFTLRIMKGNAIGTVYYNSDNKEVKGRNWIDTSQSHRATGRAIVYDANGKNLTKDEKSQVITDIHGRGESSWRFTKKSYQIKFDKKISLIDGTGKEKKWVLLAQYKDPLRMKDKITKDIAALGSDGFQPTETWVNFYFDGEYRGVYLLGEKNEIKESRVNIHDMEDDYENQDPDYGDNINTKEARNAHGNRYYYQEGLTGPKQLGGFLLEMDSDLDDNNCFEFSIDGEDHPVNLKSPELASDEAVKYISDYFQDFCDAVSATDGAGKHTGKNPQTGLYYYDYCDLTSLVDSYLLNTIVSNWDGFRKSMYFYKDRGQKMYSGPAWDFDMTFSVYLPFDVSPNRDCMTEKAISSDLIQIPSFRAAVKERYQQVYVPIIDSLLSTGELMPTWKTSYAAIRQDLAMEHVIWSIRWRDGSAMLIRWPSSTSDEEILQHYLNWLEKHEKYLNSYFRNMSVKDSDLHVYANPVAVTDTTHQRTCLYHPGETITENCIFEMAPTDGGGKGTHTTACLFCENAVTEPCDYEIVPAKKGKHTKTCKICGDSFKEPCDFDAAPNGDGTHSGVCKVCEGKVTMDCEFAYTPGADTGMHTGLCKVCGYEVTEPCDYEVKDNLDGTHTKSCKLCKNVVTEPCTCEYVNNNDGTHTGTCSICGHATTEDHAYGSPVVVRPATLTKEGLLRQDCVCGQVIDTNTPALMPEVVTINAKTVTAGSIAGLVKHVEFAGGDASTVILGKNVKKIKAKAFRGTPVKTIIVKTKKLTNKNVKASLKSSKVKTIKVNVGSKKINKEYVKKYKKIFTKKNAGKKAKVS